MRFCGFSQTPAVGTVDRKRFICPWCLGHGLWASGERCQECHGHGTTDDPDPGVDLYTNRPPGEVQPDTTPEQIPRPPGVMRQPCVDCAFRRGSPEIKDEGQALPGAKSPFYCHHGLVRRGDGYLDGSTIGGRPLGALICASWYSLYIDGGPLSAGEFRDPGGNNRAEDR